MRSLLPFVLAGAVTAAGCDAPIARPDEGPPDPGGHELTVLTTDDQVLPVGDSITLELRLAGPRNEPKPGVTVEWSVTGPGHIQPVSVTGENGVATSVLVVGRGEHRVIARLPSGERRVLVVHGCVRCGEWSVLPLSTAQRRWASAAAIDGIILVTAGFQTWSSSNAVDLFDPASSKFSAAGELPMGMGGATTAVVDGRVFVIGGSPDEYLANGIPWVLAYDRETGQWSHRTPLAKGRFLASSAVLNGRIHVIGGRVSCAYDGYCPGPLADLDIYDPVSDRWTKGPFMKEPRALAGAAVHDGKLYVAGGTSGDLWWHDLRASLSSVEMYDPSQDVWIRMLPIPDAGPMQLLALNGTLFAFVWNGDHAHAHGYTYDSESGAWFRTRNVPVSLLGPTVAAAGGRIYVFGGVEVDPADPGTHAISQYVYVLTP